MKASQRTVPTSVLAALGVEDYELPNAIEPTTPIGSKVVFERWVNDDGDSFFKVELVYHNAIGTVLV